MLFAIPHALGYTDTDTTAGVHMFLTTEMQAFTHSVSTQALIQTQACTRSTDLGPCGICIVKFPDIVEGRNGCVTCKRNKYACQEHTMCTRRQQRAVKEPGKGETIVAYYCGEQNTIYRRVYIYVCMHACMHGRARPCPTSSLHDQSKPIKACV